MLQVDHGLGTRAGLELYYKYRNLCDIRYKKYYILKCDVKKFFASINHDILKKKLLKRIKDKDALKIVYDIIDNDTEGLSIGNMTSQILAIFYLNDFDHFVKEVLKIQCYLRYQDDFVLFHSSKEYLKECLIKIREFLSGEGLTLNKKTRIYNSNCNFIFLGRDIYGKYKNYRLIKKRLKKKQYLYKIKKINLKSFVSSIQSFKYLDKRFRSIKL